MRHFLWVLPVILVGGCAGRASRPDADIFGSGLNNAARAIAVGQSYDAALLAARRGNSAAFESSMERIGRIGAPKVAWLSVAASLNNLGYPLAESGHSMQEFRRAEDLTRRSLGYWDKIIAAEPQKSETLPLLRFNREVTAHDSLAWALYRQGRFEEALTEQTAAVTAAKADAPKGSQYDSGLAEMFYHLGKIQQALGHNTEARGAFAEALKFNPAHEKAKLEAGK